MKKSRFILVVGTNLILIGLSFARINQSSITTVTANQGVVAFSSSIGNARVQLQGEWALYPNTLAQDITDSTPMVWVDGEHLWTEIEGQNLKGVATYRLTVRGLLPNTVYAITTQDEAGAYKLTVNGRYVMGNGVVSNSPETYIPAVKTVVGFFTTDESGQADFLLEMANFTRRTGGFWHALEFGFPDVIVNHYTMIVGFEVLVFAVMLSIGLLFLLFSSISKEMTSFYTSLFALIMALRVISTGTHLIAPAVGGLPLIWILKLEYWSGYFLVPVLAMILESLEFLPHSPKRERVIKGYALVVTMFILLANDVALEWSYSINRAIIVAYSLFAFYLLIQGLKKRDESAGYLLIGGIALVSGTFAELFVDSIQYAVFFTSFAFVVSVAVSVVIRFSTMKVEKGSLEKDVMTDYLTGLGNRVYLYEVLTHLPKTSTIESHYLIFIDIDDFKLINDTYGHEAGDTVLRQASLRLKAAVRDNDHVVRFAGDEFVIVVALNAGYPIESVVEWLNKQFEEPIQVEEITLQIRLSIGTSTIDPQVTDPDRIIHEADQRMYEEKTRHKQERMP
jgi:diguanylate cyclase (GGDEF)-like protein